MRKSAIINIRPKPWARTGGNHGRRFLSPAMRLYYSSIYAGMLDAGFKPLDKTKSWGISCGFCRTKGRGIPDTDNMLKAVLDAGQISSWGKSPKSLDLWNDKQFDEVAAKRFLDAAADYVLIEIYEIS